MKLKLRKPELKNLQEGFLRFISKWLALELPLFMLIALPVLTHWLKEEREVYLGELFIPLALAFLSSIIISIIFFRIFLRNRFAAYIGAISAAVILGPGYQSTIKTLSKLGLTGGIKFTLVLIICTLGCFYIMSFLINKRLKSEKWRSKTDVLTKSIFIIIAVAFSIQVFSVSKTAVTTKDQSSYQPPVSDGSAQASNNKPDIYYIVPDRYTSNEVLKKQFGYDNSDFTNFLSKNRFYVKKNAYSAYPYTPYSISSTINADYHSDMVGKFGKAEKAVGKSYLDAVHYNSVAKKLKGLGYKFYQIGTQHEPTSQAPLADKLFQPSNKLTLFNQDLATTLFVKQEIDKSIYKTFFSRGLNIGGFKIVNFVGEAGPNGILSNLESLKKLAASPSGGRFIFAHFLVPHDPFYFNADGSQNKDYHNDNVGRPVKQKYLGQVQFMNSQMKELISIIKKSSKDQAVIILQSDEGGWPNQLNLEKFAATEPKKRSTVSKQSLKEGDMREWPDKDLELKYGILAAYHIPRAKGGDIDRYIDSVNVFRIVLNSYFKDDLPYLPTCHYAFPEGTVKPFTYADITSRLTGRDNPACPKDGNFNKE